MCTYEILLAGSISFFIEYGKEIFECITTSRLCQRPGIDEIIRMSADSPSPQYSRKARWSCSKVMEIAHSPPVTSSASVSVKNNRRGELCQVQWRNDGSRGSCNVN